MRASAKKAAEKPIPRVFRKPMISASVLLALDILTLAAAAVLNAVRGSVTEKYFYNGDGTVSGSNPYALFGIAAAVLLAAAAAVTAIIIAGGFLGRKRRSDLVFETAAAAVLLALSVGAAGFSLYIVNGERPENIVFTSFTDEENRLVFAEEQYGNENLLKIYLVRDNPKLEEGECVRLACVPLAELSRGNAEERYTIKYLTESTISVAFSDGTAYRTLELTV